jgi:4-amino-4-deoxy-L-arabinose transferase-like glycosyltransferase
MGLNARTVLAAVLLLTLAARAFLAWKLPLFGDEAFYWWESRQPALGYSDVPPLVPWLMALGTRLGGNTPFGTRWPFLLLAAVVPVLVGIWARRFVGAGEARAAATLSLLLPLAAVLGVMGIPDVPLTVAILAAAIALENFARSHRWRDALMLGAILALGWLSHYRFVMIYVAGAVFLLAAPRGRALLRLPALWVGQAIGLLGLVPLIAFNLQHDWSAMRFQFIERHPWTFHASALLDPLAQALATTPLLFAAIVVALVWALRRWRAGEEGWDVLVCMAGGLLGGYLVFGLFADEVRVRFHWPLPAYLLALPAVPMVFKAWRESGRRSLALSAMAAAPLALLVTIGVYTLLGAATLPARLAWLPFGRPVPDNLQGWREIGRWARNEARAQPQATLIAGDFMLGAQAAFALRATRPVFVLEHPANDKHGRAAQLAIWQRDERGLAASGWHDGLLWVDESARRPIDRLPAWQSLCARFGAVRLRDEIALFNGRWRVVAFAVTPAQDGRAAAPCELPAMAEIDAPIAGAVLEGEHVDLRGWAIKEHIGVARVEVLLDGEPVAAARYGTPYPGVRGQWPDSTDPGHPDVGFEATLSLAAVAPGRHQLGVRIIGRDGSTRDLALRRVRVGR